MESHLCIIVCYLICFSLSWFCTLDMIFCYLISHRMFPFPSQCVSCGSFQSIALSYHVSPVTFIFPVTLALGAFRRIRCPFIFPVTLAPGAFRRIRCPFIFPVTLHLCIIACLFVTLLVTTCFLFLASVYLVVCLSVRSPHFSSCLGHWFCMLFKPGSYSEIEFFG